MKYVTTRFGEIEFKEEEIIEVAKGILGFPKLRRYVVIAEKKDSHFRWLQSVEDSSIAFVVANPTDFFPQYRIKLRLSELEELKLDRTEDLLVFVIMTVPRSNPAEISANLLGPLILNPFKRLAKQVVLTDSPYTTRHYVIEALNKRLRTEDEKVEFSAV